jgi:hypothetical protein
MSVILTPEELAARKRRNAWIALTIGLFIVLVFVITVAKMSAGLPP